MKTVFLCDDMEFIKIINESKLVDAISQPDKNVYVLDHPELGEIAAVEDMGMTRVICLLREDTDERS